MYHALFPVIVGTLQLKSSAATDIPTKGSCAIQMLLGPIEEQRAAGTLRVVAARKGVKNFLRPSNGGGRREAHDRDEIHQYHAATNAETGTGLLNVQRDVPI